MPTGWVVERLPEGSILVAERTLTMTWARSLGGWPRTLVSSGGAHVEAPVTGG